METDDLPLSNLSLRSERERRLRGSPTAEFFGMRDLPYLNIGMGDINVKWRRDSGVHGMRDCLGVLGSEDPIRDARLPMKLNV